ncbi:unnamed protein product, partial [marine sediment metagenome]
ARLQSPLAQVYIIPGGATDDQGEARSINTVFTYSLSGVNDISPQLTHFLSIFVSKQAMEVNGMEGNFTSIFQPHHDHSSDPEEKDVIASFHYRGGIEIIRSIRNARTQHKVKSNKWIEAQVYADELLPNIASQVKSIEALARARPLAILNRQERKAGKEKALILVLKEAEVLLPWTGMIDQLAEKKRLIKEKKLTQARIAQLNTRLRDNAFLTKAPPHIVEKEKQKLYLLKDKLERLKSELSQLD